MQPTSSRIDVGSSTLHVRRRTGDGPAFVLVHGLASNLLTWEGVARRLASMGHEVVSVDLRGHGASDRSETPLGMADVVDDLVGLIDRLGLFRPVLAGQSWGGNVVLTLAAVAGNAVRGVAAVDGGTIDLQAHFPRWEDCARALAPPALEGTPVDEMADMLRRSHPDWSDEAIAWQLGCYEVLPAGTIRPWLRRTTHMAILRDLWERRPSDLYPDVDVPVLLLPVEDEASSWTSGKRREVAAAERSLPRVRVRWFADSDHDVHVQRPDEVADALAGAVDGFFDA